MIWDRLKTDAIAWKGALPETADPKVPRHKADSGEWIVKPAFGRVGEDVSVKGAISEKEYRRLVKTARGDHKGWIAQRLFHSIPLQADNGDRRHLCVGVFTVDGRSAGMYGRASPYPRMDANAIDIPILVKKEAGDERRY